MRVSILFAAVALVSVGCATAVVPDGSEAETKAVGDAGDPSSDNSYSGSGDGGTTPPTSDGGKTTPPKGDSGTTSPSSCSFTGVLATYDFSSESGDQTSTAAASKATGVTAGDLKRASALTAVSGSGSINASGWTTSPHVDTSRYYTLSITPPSGCSLDLSSVSIATQASGSGPATGAVATDDDSFSAKTTFTIGGTDSPSLSVSSATGAVEVRIYGYAATSASGTMRIDNTLTISGSLK